MADDSVSTLGIPPSAQICQPAVILAVLRTPYYLSLASIHNLEMGNNTPHQRFKSGLNLDCICQKGVEIYSVYP